MLLQLSACADIESELTFENFRNQVISAAGDGATDCGEAEIGEGGEQNQCVAFNFGQELPSFAIYNQEGTDSMLARSFAVNAQGRVFQLFFNLSLIHI